MDEISIRARRRDANKLYKSLPDATNREKSLEANSEKTDLCIAKSKYPNIIILCDKPRVPVKREIILNFRRKRKMRFMKNKRIHSLILCMMLIVAMAFGTVGCNTKKQDDKVAEVVVQETTDNEQSESVEEKTAESTAEVRGEGQTVFLFTVVDKDGNETNFEIHTDKETVGEALLDLELISGEDSEYGLFVKEVNGIIADYGVDQTYWAFYVDGEYAMSGVDTTVIEEGKAYAFKVAK